MASQGPFGGATGTEDATVGTSTWLNTSRIVSDDANFAFAAIDALAVSRYVKGVAFVTFTVPSDATIVGVEATAKATVTGNLGDVQDSSVKLVKGGTISGNDLATNTGWPTPGTEASRTWGGPTEMWGLTLTPTDVNAATFGFVASFTNTDAVNGRSCSLQYYSMSVYYTLPGSSLSGFRHGFL